VISTTTTTTTPPPTELPRTGADSTVPLALAGLGLLIGGAFLRRLGME
jgi:LPXTG-motif cell wall-anchored protein